MFQCIDQASLEVSVYNQISIRQQDTKSSRVVILNTLSNEHNEYVRSFRLNLRNLIGQKFVYLPKYVNNINPSYFAPSFTKQIFCNNIIKNNTKKI